MIKLTATYAVPSTDFQSFSIFLRPWTYLEQLFGAFRKFVVKLNNLVTSIAAQSEIEFQCTSWNNFSNLKTNSDVKSQVMTRHNIKRQWYILCGKWKIDRCPCIKVSERNYLWKSKSEWAVDEQQAYSLENDEFVDEKLNKPQILKILFWLLIIRVKSLLIY